MQQCYKIKSNQIKSNILIGFKIQKQDCYQLHTNIHNTKHTNSKRFKYALQVSLINLIQHFMVSIICYMMLYIYPANDASGVQNGLTPWAVEDLEGVRVDRLNPPLEPNYFTFMGKFMKNLLNDENNPPFDGFEPPFQKSWIRPCKGH